MRPERSPVHSKNSMPSAPTPVLRAQSLTASAGSGAPSMMRKSLPQAWALVKLVIGLPCSNVNGNQMTCSTFGHRKMQVLRLRLAHSHQTSLRMTSVFNHLRKQVSRGVLEYRNDKCGGRAGLWNR